MPVASIKYFLRQGLLPAGRATAATLAEYGDEHAQRLRLIKALTTLGGLSIAATREVLGAVDHAHSSESALGAVSYALPVPVAAQGQGAMRPRGGGRGRCGRRLPRWRSCSRPWTGRRPAAHRT